MEKAEKMLRLINRGIDFRNGVEYGRILECIANGKDVIGVEVEHRIRAENVELVEETCRLSGYSFDISQPDAEGWCKFEAKKIIRESHRGKKWFRFSKK